MPLIINMVKVKVKRLEVGECLSALSALVVRLLALNGIVPTVMSVVVGTEYKCVV
jgi:hypothetical protein